MIFTHLAGRPRPVASKTFSNASPIAPAVALRELLVADGASADIGELVDNARVPLLLLKPSANALQEITAALAGQPLDVLHLAAHGRAGAVYLGGQWIDTRSLAAASAMLVQWKVATIALWSCHSGNDHTLAEVLAALTGARVLVSQGALGMVDGAPHWELLEAGSAGASPAAVAAPFERAVMARWPHQLAKLSFVNAYRVNSATTPAAKEANSVDFSVTALNVARIDDRSGGQNFSGNDVVVEALIDGVAFYGWISRPIKSGGVVRGFYFWTDPQFTSLSAATADGNADGDGNALDNLGFILVVDQAWFDAIGTLAGSGGTLKNVGTSSDRIDSGLNGLLAVNSLPTPVNDGVILLEDGGAQGGNVLANDSDANNDSLTVTGFSIGGVGGTLGAAFTINGVGSFTLAASGAYSFTPVAGYSGKVPLISYSVNDGRGGTGSASLALSVAQVNDAPSGTSTTLTVGENSAYTFSAADFGFSDGADNPAHTLASVVLTTLPASGSLTLGGVAVTVGDEVALADLTRLKFVPAADASGTGYASFTFQVRDSGGSANGGSDLDASPNTITLDVSDINSNPVGQADSATTAASASGNLLANDSDADSGDTLTLTAASGKTGVESAVTSNTAIAGHYGSLTVSADGSYTYVVDTANSAVQALRNSGATLTDNFAYSLSDGDVAAGAVLSITVQGANDSIDARDDFTFAIASNISGPRLNPVGNVLTNDSDPDSGDSMSVSRASTGTSLGGTIVSVDGSGSVNGGESRAYTGFTTQGAGNINDGAAITGTGVPTGTTVGSVNNAQGGARVVVFANSSGNLVALDGVTHVTIAGNSYQIDARNGMSATVIAITNPSGTISGGMSISGSGIQNGTTVSSVVNSATVSMVTLSQGLSGTLGTDLVFGTSGASLVGSYGSLLLQADGSYTYTANTTPTGGTDTFTYEVLDASGVASTAQLTVQVVASNVAPPTAAADSGSTTEDGAALTGNVLSNDSQASGTKIVSDAWSPTASAMSAVAPGGTSVTGRYGSLVIADDGSYTYTADHANASVNALTAGASLSESFQYRMGSNSIGYAVATITVTINGANDAPAALADTARAREAGGNANAGTGIDPSGNVLRNDSDVDSGDTLSVAMAGTSAATTVVGAGTSSANGLVIAGSYGSLTLGADGSYRYAVDNANASVQAMIDGASLADSFTYQVKDASGATHDATLSVAIADANDAPTIATGAGPSIMEGASGAVSGIVVADVDHASLAVSLSVRSGTLSIGTLGSATISAGANASAALTLSGTSVDINAALATLSYQGASDFYGIDSLRISAADGGGLSTVGTLDITVNPDNRALTVSAPTVNEASAYAVFSVTGAVGQKVTLALAASGSGAGHADSGADFIAGLEYYDGTAWQDYNGNPASVPAGGVLLVRSAILNDLLDEGAETFTLNAANRAGVSYSGDATIVDNGTGLVYSGAVSGGVPASAATGLDDDRALQVSSSTVNEKSPYAMFELLGASGQLLSLALANGNAGNADHGSAIEYYDGAAWQSYSVPLNLPAGGALKLRVAIVDDSSYEGPEVFGLVATNGSGRAFVGTATIVDDGTGLIYPGTLSGGAIVSTASGLDNDLALSVAAHGPVNEGSAYAMFTVTATPGETLDLAVAGSGLAPATTSAFSLAFSSNGSSWTAYADGVQPVVPAGGVVYVRIDVSSEQDNVIEGSEGFTLNAAIGSGAGKSASASTSIVDNGSGSIYSGVVTAGTPVAVTSGLDHDTVLDTTAPTIALASNAGTGTPIGVGQSATITFTLSEASVNFSAADVSVSGGTLSAFSGSGNLYTATFTPAANSTVSAVLSVASAVFADGAGNLNADGADADNSLTLAIDTVPPAPPAPVPGAPLAAPQVTIVDDANNDGILGKHELQGTVEVSIALPAGAAAGDVLNISSGTLSRSVTLDAAAIAGGSVATSFPAPPAGAAISVSASVTTAAGVAGASGSDSAVRASGVALAVTAVSPDTGIVGDFITGARTLVFSGTAESGTLVSVKLNGTLLGSAIAVNDRWSYDNSAVALPSGSNTLTVFDGNHPDDSTSVLVQVFSAELNPAADDGISNQDHQTSVTTPDFILKADNIMVAGDTARLVDVRGAVVGSLPISATHAGAGQINVPTDQLDDGSYTFVAQILDAAGNVKASQPVSVTIVTDRDGVMPSVELASHGGDFNRDGIADWQQNNVAQLPLSSVEAFAAGKAAPAASFGAIMAGALSAANSGGAVQLDANAQLLDVGVRAAPAPLPANTTAATPMLAFSVTGTGNTALADLDPGRAGVQTRVVIDLPDGVNANVFMKFDATTSTWFSFNDDQRLDTFDDGATLLDTNGDGRIDRMVITLTDGARGDEDGLANGIIVDPGMLALQAAPVYSVLLAGGDRFYTTSAGEAASMATGTANVFEGVRFDSLAASAGGQQVFAKWQPFTRDFYFGSATQTDPYLCYELVAGAAGFMAADASAGIGESFHLYLNKAGQTQLLTQLDASTQGLAGKGYADMGAQFRTTTSSAFAFDPEAFLIANKDNAQTQAFVQSLTTKFQHSSNAGFIDAVEQHYLSQVSLVGVPHGGTATVAELNAVFGTHFVL